MHHILISLHLTIWIQVSSTNNDILQCITFPSNYILSLRSQSSSNTLFHTINLVSYYGERQNFIIMHNNRQISFCKDGCETEELAPQKTLKISETWGPHRVILLKIQVFWDTMRQQWASSSQHFRVKKSTAQPLWRSFLYSSSFIIADNTSFITLLWCGYKSVECDPHNSNTSCIPNPSQYCICKF
jgi:hypothetical protein